MNSGRDNHRLTILSLSIGICPHHLSTELSCQVGRHTQISPCVWTKALGGHKAPTLLGISSGHGLSWCLSLSQGAGLQRRCPWRTFWEVSSFSWRAQDFASNSQSLFPLVLRRGNIYNPLFTVCTLDGNGDCGSSVAFLQFWSRTLWSKTPLVRLGRCWGKGSFEWQW